MRISKVCRALSLILVIALQYELALAQEDRFDAGVAANERGHFATALRAWLPMAEEGVAEAQNNVGHMYERGWAWHKTMRWRCNGTGAQRIKTSQKLS